MRAVDTNVVVRLLIDDDPDQSRRARAVFDAGDLFIRASVLLETEWVLRSIYGFTALAIIDRLRVFPRLPRVVIDDPRRLATALDWAAAGIDLADAFHLAGARDCTAFISFDRALARSAARAAALPVVEP